MNCRNFKNGFTLAEVLITTSILAVISVAIFSVFMTGVSSWQIGEAKTQTQQETRRAMEMMSKELRLSSAYHLQVLNDSGIQAYSGTRIIFQMPVYSQQQVQVDTGGQLVWGAEGTQGYWVSYQLVIPQGETSGQLKRLVLTGDKITKISSAVLANRVAAIEFNGLPNNTYTPSSLEIILTKRNIIKGTETDMLLKSRIWLRN
ncbi:MAG: prepilin-type N-terminal cleavage/methylation domain-containing protein [Candidatus Omnitrophica bacterium]|jgi:prepilin-type N-terminal cleavage/methylation domain-containing protein|nr:prepilin-type N-terminal cleavage/methylation domain-containing protein [Candidatus Omnitrophota bacterium]